MAIQRLRCGISERSCFLIALSPECVGTAGAYRDCPVTDTAGPDDGRSVMAEERRVVTVLFADLVGSTGIGETLDPEDLRQFLASYFSAAQEIIEEYGG